MNTIIAYGGKLGADRIQFQIRYKMVVSDQLQAPSSLYPIVKNPQQPRNKRS